MNQFKRMAVAWLTIMITHSGWANPIEKFDRIEVGPHINLVIKKGMTSEVKIEALGIDTEKINVKVKNGKLIIYLDGARHSPPKRKIKNNDMTYKENVYKKVDVTAFITYEKLKSIEMKGEEQLTSEGIVDEKKLKIKLYGGSVVNIDQLTVDLLKVKTFGQNTVNLYNGSAEKIFFRAYGQNKINSTGVKSEVFKTTIFGEGKVQTFANERIKVSCLGESKIQFGGNPLLNKGIILGETDFVSL